MRLRIDEVSFDSPAGLDDHTVYDFRSDPPFDELKVRFERPAGAATPAADEMATVHERLDGLPVPGFSVDAPADAELLGNPGQSLYHRFADRGATVHGYTLIANIGHLTELTPAVEPGDWVKLGWSMAGDRADLDARVDAVVASLAPVEDPPPAAPASGWVRRQAGAWAFDLPEHLGVPRIHLWRHADERLALSITVHELDADEPELDAALLDAGDHGYEEVARDELELDLELGPDAGPDSGKGALLRAHLREPDSGDERFMCCARVRVELGGDPPQLRHVQINADGPWAGEARLRQLVDDLLASLTQEPAP